MLTPMGWLEASSAPAQSLSNSLALTSSIAVIFCKTKLPLVIVPVLSITTALTFFKASIAKPLLKRIPCLEPAPIPEK